MLKRIFLCVYFNKELKEEGGRGQGRGEGVKRSKTRLKRYVGESYAELSRPAKERGQVHKGNLDKSWDGTEARKVVV